jgi:hypothetical protein
MIVRNSGGDGPAPSVPLAILLAYATGDDVPAQSGESSIDGAKVHGSRYSSPACSSESSTRWGSLTGRDPLIESLSQGEGWLQE